MAAKNFIFKGKLVVVGDIAVGKTSIVSRLTENKFVQNQPSSVGVAYSSKTIRVDPTTTVKFDIWDTAGQERFRSISALFYRGSAAGIIVYDVTDRNSFDTVAKFWFRQLKQYALKDIIIALAGNKSDLVDKRAVAKTEVEAYCKANNMIHLETSAKTGQNIEQLFVEIARRVPKALDGGGFKVVEVAAPPEDLEDGGGRKKKCCGS